MMGAASSSIRQLPPQQPHYPARCEHSSDEEREAVQTVADLLHGGVALRNSKNRGGEHCEQHSGAEVRESEGHGFFPSAMW